MKRSEWSKKPGFLLGGVLAGAVLSSCLAATVVGAQEPSADSGLMIPGMVIEAQGELPEMELQPVPLPSLDGLEQDIADQLQEIQDRLAETFGQRGAGREDLGEAYGELARHYHTYDLAASAEPCYLNAATLQPKSVRWPHLLGHLYWKTGHLEAARPQLERAIELRPDDTPAMIYLAEIALAESRPDDARTLFEAVLGLEPDNLVARAMLAELDLGEGSYEEAVTVFEEVLATRPEANRFRYPLAMAYRALGRVDDARAQLALRGEVGLAPTDGLVAGLLELKRGERVYVLRGRRAFKAGRYAEAAEAFTKAVAANPASSGARVNLGTALAFLGRKDEAVAEYRAALEHDPANGTAHHNLGRLLVEAGDTEGAYEHFQAALVADPRDVASMTELAALLHHGGRSEEALEYYAKTIELAPTVEDAQLRQAGILVDLGRYAEARTTLEDAVAQLPQAGRLVHALARLLAGAPDPEVRDGERAVELAELVWKARPSVGHAETLAMAFAQSDRCADAAAWQRVAITQLDEGGESAARRGYLEQVLSRYEGATSCRPPG